MKNVILAIILISQLLSCQSGRKSKGKLTSHGNEGNANHSRKDISKSFSCIYLKGTSIQGDTDECTCFLRNDTIILNTGGMLLGGTAFNLSITKDTFISTIDHFVDSDFKTYKLDKDDTALHVGISLPAVFQKMHLDSRPKFELDETISGWVSIKSKSYYHLMEKETTGKNHTQGSDGFYLKKDSDDVRFFFKCKVGMDLE